MILFYIILYFSLFILIGSQSLKNSFNNTICTQINNDQLKYYVNFDLMEKSISNIIKNNPYPLNNRKILNSVIKDKNPCPFREKVLLKMSKNETINVVIVGGSLTQGIYLKKQSQKRWTDIISDYLNSGWYSGQFKINNIALGGFSIFSWSQRFDDFYKYDIDILITDFTVNEIDLSPASIYQAYETFVRIFETLHTKPAVLYNLMFALQLKSLQSKAENNSTIELHNSNDLIGYYKYWKVSDYATDVLRKHKIPSTSFRNLVYPDFYNPPNDLTNIWTNHFVHPNGTTHKYIADHIYNTFIFLINNSYKSNLCNKESEINNCYKLGYVDPKNYDPKARPICKYGTILNNMESNNDIESKNSFIMGPNFNETTNKWKFYNDSNTYGWIFNSTDLYTQRLMDRYLYKLKDNINSTDIDKDYILSFQFNIEDSLQLSYLKSFPNGYGNILFWFDDDTKNTFLLKTRWKNPKIHPFSLPYTISIRNQNTNIYKNLVLEGFIIPSLKNGKHIINIIAIPPYYYKNPSWFKVKVIGIKTC